MTKEVEKVTLIRSGHLSAGSSDWSFTLCMVSPRGSLVIVSFKVQVMEGLFLKVKTLLFFE